MPPERDGLAAAARRKRADALARASAAVTELDARGERIDFQAVARCAGVSRQWLYKQPELRGEIERLRALRSDRAERTVPARERSSEASLRQRLHALLGENRRLREDNAELNAQLALAYGHQREFSAGGQSPSVGV